MGHSNQSSSPKKKVLRWLITRGGVLFALGLVLYVWMLPSLLNGANKAKEVQAKIMVRDIAEAQESYFLSKQAFANNMLDLDIISKNILKDNKFQTSGFYKYSISRPSSSIVQVNAWPTKIEQWPKTNLRSYISFVWNEEKITHIKVCKQNEALPVVPDDYYFPIGTPPSCPEDYQESLEYGS